MSKRESEWEWERERERESERMRYREGEREKGRERYLHLIYKSAAFFSMANYYFEKFGLRDWIQNIFCIYLQDEIISINQVTQPHLFASKFQGAKVWIPPSSSLLESFWRLNNILAIAI